MIAARVCAVALAALATAGAGSGATGLSVRVDGNRLVDARGHPLRLLGVNHSSLEYMCVSARAVLADGPIDARAIAAMKTWRINAVRVALNEACWLGINGAKPGGPAYRRGVAAYVSHLHAAGLIVILELHFNAPGALPAKGQQVMPDADHTPAFWTSVARTFRHDRALILDLYNEPHDISWRCWRDGCRTADGWQAAGMQTLVKTVRASGFHGPIMLGGIAWSNDLTQWLRWRPADPDRQLIASFHLYDFTGCANEDCWNGTIAPVAKVVPVVTGEVGEKDCAHGFIDSYMAWADAHGISYLGWTWNVWDCRAGPALISAWDGTPTSFGIGFRDHLAAISRAS